MRNLTMKTKVLVLLGIILAVLSAFAVAGGPLTSPWSTGHSQTQMPTVAVLPTGASSSNEALEPPLVITKDINILRGRGFFHVEGGVLYKEEVHADGTLATTSQNVATGSIRLSGPDGGT